jgi:hypothetical protein
MSHVGLINPEEEEEDPHSPEKNIRYKLQEADDNENLSNFETGYLRKR